MDPTEGYEDEDWDEEEEAQFRQAIELNRQLKMKAAEQELLDRQQAEAEMYEEEEPVRERASLSKPFNPRASKQIMQQRITQQKIDRENAHLVRHMNDINRGSKQGGGFSHNTRFQTHEHARGPRPGIRAPPSVRPWRPRRPRRPRRRRAASIAARASEREREPAARPTASRARQVAASAITRKRQSNKIIRENRQMAMRLEAVGDSGGIRSSGYGRRVQEPRGPLAKRNLEISRQRRAPRLQQPEMNF